jgi:sec-independent protein translocase protein TatB
VFNLSGSEILFLLLAGLVVLGPERLPGVIRQVGRVYGEFRRMASGFEKEFKSTFEEPINELRRSAQDLTSTFTDDFGSVDNVPSPPMSDAKTQLPDDLMDPSIPPAADEDAKGDDQ